MIVGIDFGLILSFSLCFVLSPFHPPPPFLYPCSSSYSSFSSPLPPTFVVSTSCRNLSRHFPFIRKTSHISYGQLNVWKQQSLFCSVFFCLRGGFVTILIGRNASTSLLVKFVYLIFLFCFCHSIFIFFILRQTIFYFFRWHRVSLGQLHQ